MKKRALMFSAGGVAVALAVALLVINMNGSTRTFPGTDVEYMAAEDGVNSDGDDCAPYPSTIGELVSGSATVVVGTVEASEPTFEQTYGTPTPRKVNGELPPAKDVLLNRVITLDVERALSGPAQDQVAVYLEGWQDDGDSWIPITFSDYQWLDVGQRVVIPLWDADTADSKYAPYTLPCTGVFVFDESGEPLETPDFKNDLVTDGYFDMSESEVIAAFRSEIG